MSAFRPSSLGFFVGSPLSGRADKNNLETLQTVQTCVKLIICRTDFDEHVSEYHETLIMFATVCTISLWTNEGRREKRETPEGKTTLHLEDFPILKDRG